MTAFSGMSSLLWGAVGTWLLFLFLGFVFLETFALLAKQNPNRYFYPPVLVLLYCMLQSVLWLTPMEESPEHFPLPVRLFVDLPYIVLLLACSALTVLMVYFVLQCRVWKKEHITDMSVKYAVDAFPEGICCYDDNGLVVLKNRAMEHFCRLVTGESLKNGVEFHAELCEGRLSVECEIRTVEDQLFVVAAGKAFSVTEKPLEHRGRLLHLLAAADISEEYHKTEELLLRQAQVRRLNEKLKGYNQEISAVITARETLSARVKIHDELGLSLLTAKRYLLTGGSKEEKQAIIAALKQQIRYLRSEQRVEKNDEYSQLLVAADDLGFRIRSEGTLPENALARHIFVTAIHECVTNTIRHAHGDTVTVDLRKTEHAYMEQIRNNGERPTGPIVEKGGLAALREMVTAQGGTMKVEAEDGFLLEIVLPKEGLDEI